MFPVQPIIQALIHSSILALLSASAPAMKCARSFRATGGSQRRAPDVRAAVGPTVRRLRDGALTEQIAPYANSKLKFVFPLGNELWNNTENGYGWINAIYAIVPNDFTGGTGYNNVQEYGAARQNASHDCGQGRG